MDHVLENKFLNKENLFKQAYKEEDSSLNKVEDQEGLDQEEDVSKEQYQYQVYDSFVKEKTQLIGYIASLVLYSAKSVGIDPSVCFTKDEAHVQMKDLVDIQDVYNIKNRINIILEKYQEQSNVLDSILEKLVGPIMKFFQVYIKQTISTANYFVPKHISQLFEIIHWICKVRGYKTVVKFFPHEVADMEPVVEILHFQESDEWWISYVLILWLSIIVLVPFDIDTIDSKTKNHEVLVKRIINIGKSNIANSGKIREATAVLLSKVLTRPDVIKSGETDMTLNFLAVEYQQCKNDTNQMFFISGILQTLTEIFKLGHREDLIMRVDTVFDPILKGEVKNKFMSKSTNIRKFKVQLAQRIGCIFLKPKIAKWRYQRGFRNLQQNLSSSIIQEESKVSEAVTEDDEQMEEEDINFEQLEFIIQYLLDSLKDDDSSVRWTAAKGIGRITGRMNKDFADQIVESLYTSFDDNETDSTWHGGCLALAELCRRGLLLPERLSKFIPILDKALIYDINRGNHSIGAHVRDAACYVVWSFARAYSPDIMKPHVHTLSTQLIVESLFDREVNCRRAASATFQECVGRQGNFPYGIEILTEADYFTLSNRVNAFLNVSCFVGQFPDYFESMVSHITFIKLRHWEPVMRSLSAQTLSVIASFNPEKVVTQFLTPLIDLCLDKALQIRHGAILGVGEIIIGLSGNSIINRREVLERAFKSLSMKERKLIEESESAKIFKSMYSEVTSKNYLSECMLEGSDILNKVKDIIHQVDHLRLYRGKGGEIMRTGVCHLIHSMSLAKINFSEKERLYLFKQLQENFKHPNIEIQEEAQKGFGSFCQAYFNQDPIDSDKLLIQEIILMFKPSNQDENIAITRGYNMAFGVLSKPLLKILNPDIFDIIAKNCIPRGKETDDPETRKAAVSSLISTVRTFGIKELTLFQIQNFCETLYKCQDDYQLDRRGDVGSWVREESMLAIRELIGLIVNSDSNIISGIGADKPQFFERFVCSLLQQLMEKIDKVREVAGRQLQYFFKYISHKVCNFSDKDQLTVLFLSQQNEDQGETSEQSIGYLPWRSADFVFNSITPYFDSQAFSLSILKGLITSSGGLTESTLKASSNSLFEYLSKMSKDGHLGIQNKRDFLSKILKIFEENLSKERVTIPLMKTIEMLLTSDYLSDQELLPELLRLHSIIVQECSKSKNIVKLICSAGVLTGMMTIQNWELGQKVIKSLLSLLYHSFPKVRKLTSEKLYTALLSLEEYSYIIPTGEADYDGAIEMISETNWSDHLKTLASGKEKMYAFFGLQPTKPESTAVIQPTIVEESKKDGDTEMIQT